MKTVILVHGAWHGPSCWHKVVAGLKARGVPVVAVELPLLEGLARDADVTRAAIDAAGGPTIVCGHSYGGQVISLAATGAKNVEHLVYLCAFQLAPEESIGAVLQAHGSGIFEAIRHEGETRVLVPEKAAEVFYGDSAADDIAGALRSLRPMPAAPAPNPPTPPAWHAVPSTYVVCSEDRAIPPAAQREMARHATSTVTWPTSHSPFLSRPDLVIDLLAALAEGADSLAGDGSHAR